MDSSEALEERTRESIALPLARVVYLASLRDHNTDRYSHAGWAFALGDEQADRALRDFHLAEFRKLLALSVPDWVDQCETYFEQLGEPVANTVLIWRDLESYRTVVPRGCHPVDRELFFSSLRAALAVLADRILFPLQSQQSASLPLSPGR